jgi:hypothetical protein
VLRAEEQRRVKGDENKEQCRIGIRGAKNTIYDDKGEKQAILKEERERKFPAGRLSREKHRG